MSPLLVADTPRLEDLHLRYDKTGYSIYVLGKAGEPRPYRKLYVSAESR